MLLAARFLDPALIRSSDTDEEQMAETKTIEGYLKDLLSVMVARAEKEVDAVMPGYTHLQVSLEQRMKGRER